MKSKLLLVVLVVIVLVGCSTTTVESRQSRSIYNRPKNLPKSMTVFEVKPFLLVVGPLTDIQRLSRKRGHTFPVLGFADVQNRVIYTYWSMSRTNQHGYAIPDPTTLGHEVWHLPELGKYWHQKYDTNNPRAFISP